MFLAPLPPLHTKQLPCPHATVSRQVARQQGEYLAEALRLADGNVAELSQLAPPFRYAHKGSMAYVGGGELRWPAS